MQENNSNIIVYNDGELKVSFENETIWLTQKQIAKLFNVENHTINYHIKNIYKQKKGERVIERDIDHYNLVFGK